MPVAVISLKEGYDLESMFIESILKDKLAKYEIPAYYYFVDGVLKTKNGKIDKKRIRGNLENQKECI
ncbi:hypothetical protein [Lentibacillus amyloliquefaciens]|uniref:hypothetical protein n=1 Tax=Lentibacillus amyloliquefaciens TaxID=1472767 RepID=UPI001F170E1A|nr:hypothetical protein [Lentibacillus amyloliquefaciens]